MLSVFSSLVSYYSEISNILCNIYFIIIIVFFNKKVAKIDKILYVQYYDIWNRL